jgi:hypothetical protein
MVTATGGLKDEEGMNRARSITINKKGEIMTGKHRLALAVFLVIGLLAADRCIADTQEEAQEKAIRELEFNKLPKPLDRKSVV